MITQNFQGHPSSASHVFPDPTIPWMPLDSQNLNAKYIDPPILNQVTDLIFCPCSLSVPVSPGCLYTPRLKNQKNISEIGEINLHPNPASEILTVNNIYDCKNIKVINLMGQVKMDIVVNNGSIEIDISKLAPGVYILKADELTSNRFIKL